LLLINCDTLNKIQCNGQYTALAHLVCLLNIVSSQIYLNDLQSDFVPLIMAYSVRTPEAWIQHDRTWAYVGLFKETIGKTVLLNTFPHVHGEGFKWLAMFFTRFKHI
jgi:hypothetical protein